MFGRHEARHAVVDGIFGASRVVVESEATILDLRGEFVCWSGSSCDLLFAAIVLRFVGDS